MYMWLCEEVSFKGLKICIRDAHPGYNPALAAGQKVEDFSE